MDPHLEDSCSGYCFITYLQHSAQPDRYRTWLTAWTRSGPYRHWQCPGPWAVEIAYRFSHTEPGGTDLTSLRLLGHHPGSDPEKTASSQNSKDSYPSPPAPNELGPKAYSKWLATSPATQVWADRDEPKAGRAPPGQRHGRELVHMINSAGGNATALHTPSPHKDPAAAAAAIGFNDADPSWPGYARTLSETTDWPRWEIARQAMAMCVEEA